MTQRHRAIILLAGSALIACAGAAQEAQPARWPRFSHLPHLPGGNSGQACFHQGKRRTYRISGRDKGGLQALGRGVGARPGGPGCGGVSASQEEHPGKLPPLADVWLYDAAARRRTVCLVADRECQVDEYYPPSPISFFPCGGARTVCIEGVCQVPAQDERVRCGEEKLEQTFLGQYSIGGITLGRTLMMCRKPDGSGVGTELWHNTEFDIDFDVLRCCHKKARRTIGSTKSLRLCPTIRRSSRFLLADIPFNRSSCRSTGADRWRKIAFTLTTNPSRGSE